MVKRVGLLIGLLGLVGCGGSTEETLPAPQKAETTSKYTVTIVRVLRDGAHQVTVRPLDPEQERRAVAAKQAMGEGKIQEEIALDTGCAGSSVWLYDKPDGWNGGANKICFSSGGWVRFCHPDFAYWCNNVKSMWGGALEVIFASNDVAEPPCNVLQHYGPYAKVNLSLPDVYEPTMHQGDGECNRTRNQFALGGIPRGYCPHNICATGVKIPNDGMCHACVAPVCAVMPSCCTVSWTAACVAKAKQVDEAKQCNGACAFCRTSNEPCINPAPWDFIPHNNTDGQPYFN